MKTTDTIDTYQKLERRVINALTAQLTSAEIRTETKCDLTTAWPHDRSNKNRYCAGGPQHYLEVLMTETAAATEGVEYE